MQQPSLLEFPCDFILKIIGRNQLGFDSLILDIVQNHYPKIDANAVKFTPSASANYLSISVTVPAQNQAELDALYRKLSSIPEVITVL